MMRFLAGLLAALQLASFAGDGCRLAIGMKSGWLLRLHVVAQDDTEEMQRIKECVRDAVQDAYAQGAQPGSMLSNARRLLPTLTQAAEDCAHVEGFTGQVRVCLETRAFDARELDGVTVPAGVYPALMVYLGDAAGHNWWGLLDPALAWRCAGGDGAHTGWDWSLDGLWAALRTLWRPVQEGV